MQLYITEVKLFFTDLKNERQPRCFICEEEFPLIEGQTAYLWASNQDDAIGEVCPRCRLETPEAIRASLRVQAKAKHEIARLRVFAANTFEKFGTFLRDVEKKNLSVIQAALEMQKIFHAEQSRKDGLFEEAALLDRLSKAEKIITLKPKEQVHYDAARAGYVYLLGSPEGYSKIGRTKNLSARMLSIGLQLPFRVELIHSIEVSDCIWAERYLHEKFAKCRLNGEWFALTAKDIAWIKSLTTLEPDE